MTANRVGRTWRLATLVGLCILAGCASQSSSPSLFLLDDGGATPTKPAPADAPTLVVAPVNLAPYLSQGGIVYETAPNRVVVANDNRWAAPLAGDLTQTLATGLASRLSQVQVAQAGTQSSDAYRLRVHVDKFLGRFDGNALIVGRWTLIDPDDHQKSTGQFQRRVPLPSDGYPTLVASLSKGWQRVAAAMAPKLAQAIGSEHSKSD